MSTLDAPGNTKGWLLYDGSCGFCSRWGQRWQGVLGRRGYEVTPLQTDWVVEKLNLTPEQIAADVRMVEANGHQRVGSDVYRYFLSRIWWAYPIYLLSITPGLRGIFNYAYRHFADNRYWISRTCHMPVQEVTSDK